jgi:hypothetical protein
VRNCRGRLEQPWAAAGSLPTETLRRGRCAALCCSNRDDGGHAADLLPAASAGSGLRRSVSAGPRLGYGAGT